MHNYLSRLLSGLGIIDSLSLTQCIYSVYLTLSNSPIEIFWIIRTYIVGRAALGFIFHAM